MAMKELVEGECGGANALLQMTSHLTKDQSLLQEDLARGYYQSQLTESQLSDGNEFVQEFMRDQPKWTSELHMAAPSTFHMSSLLQEMQEIEKAAFHPPVTGPGIADLANSKDWIDEFLADEPAVQQSQEYILSNSASPLPLQNVESLKFASEYLSDVESDQSHLQSSPSIWDDDALKNLELVAAARDLCQSVDDPKINETEFMSFVKKIKDGEIILPDENFVELTTDAEKLAPTFLETDEGGEARAAIASSVNEGNWAEEFSDKFSNDVVKKEAESDYWEKLQTDWDKLMKDKPEQHPWLSQFEEVNDVYKEYAFENENNLIDHPNAFQDGLNRLKQNDLPSAVLLFESAVQKDPKHVEAWYYLGTSQAENEQDIAAISALRKCLELDPTNLDCILALAVSYTNESLQSQACYMLYEWIKCHPEYSKMVSSEYKFPNSMNISTLTSSLMSRDVHQKVTDMYIKSARVAPSKVDADVQSGLGILFNLSGDYDKAVDCFHAALQIKPNDALLWNRLGATLANGNRSEEAVDAYHEALKLSPGFIRCRYNLGVSCVNLGSYREAAQHLLTGLNIQAAAQEVPGKFSQSVMSDNIWSTLRLVISLLDRTDFFQVVDARDLSALNSEFMPSESILN